MSENLHRVMLCLASNYQQEQYMAAARERVATLMGDLHFTSEHWTEPVATHGDRNAVQTASTQRSSPHVLYLNQLATGTTTLGVEALNQRLKEIERELDRKHDGSGIVTIDIDLLEYDGERHHLHDWERDYVKDLLIEL